MNLKNSILCVLIFILSSGISMSQIDCECIQCDCENIPDADKDPGLIELCMYIERSIIDNCKTGDSNPGCCDTVAAGPKAWDGIADPCINEDIFEEVKSISDIKFCNHLISYVRKYGTMFGNIKVASDVFYRSYFKEAWAFDHEGIIYVVVAMSKDKIDGYTYSLIKQPMNDSEIQIYVFCGITAKAWRGFSDVCSGCDYEKRFNEYIKEKKCDCL